MDGMGSIPLLKMQGTKLFEGYEEGNGLFVFYSKHSHLPVPNIFGTRRRSLPDMLATAWEPKGSKYIGNWKMRVTYTRWGPLTTTV